MALVNAFGEIGLEKTLQKMAQYLQLMASSLGKMYPDTAGRMRVNVEAGALSSVATVTTLGNQTMQAGFQTSYDQYAQIQMCANGVRSQIKVS